MTSVTKFNANTVKTGREIAGDIKAKLEGGAVHIPTMDLAQAKSILGDLQKMTGKTPSQKGSLTRAVNTLNDAIQQGEMKNMATNLTDMRFAPGGGPGDLGGLGGTGKPPGSR